MDDPITIKEAVRVTGRGLRTIERWISTGKLDVIVSRDASGRVIRRMVSEEELFKVLREMNRANPAHAKITDDGIPPC